MLRVAERGTVAERCELAGRRGLPESVVARLSADEDLDVVTVLLMRQELAEAPLRALEERLRELGIAPGPETVLSARLGEQRNAGIEAKLASQMSRKQRTSTRSWRLRATAQMGRRLLWRAPGTWPAMTSRERPRRGRRCSPPAYPWKNGTIRYSPYSTATPHSTKHA